MVQKIKPWSWFDGKAEDAARLRTSIFMHSAIERSTERSATFQPEEQTFIALNGGPAAAGAPAISFCVDGSRQAEVG